MVKNVQISFSSTVLHFEAVVIEAAYLASHSSIQAAALKQVQNGTYR